jgi:hypothetical protein
MSVRIEQRDDDLVIIGDCCKNPCANIDRELGVLAIRARHGSDKHSNNITPAELRMIADEIERQTVESG